MNFRPLNVCRSVSALVFIAMLLPGSGMAQQSGTGSFLGSSPSAVREAGTANAGATTGASVTGMPATSSPVISNQARSGTLRDERQDDAVRERAPTTPQPADPPNEFQQFVSASVGRYLPLFGHSLFSGSPSTFAPVDRIPVTADYVVGPGDEVLIRAWGQVDIDYRAVVDRNGTIHIPQVGTITVGGLRYQDLNGFIRASIARIFRNFELTVNLGQLRSVQVFVVGQAKRPGAYTVSSLSTLVNALFASGGPSTRGSMRRIQLKRGDKVVSEFDVYDLLRKGDKSKDVRLQPGDVIYIPPVGDLVAVSGSVNEPAIYELKTSTSLGDVIELASGLSTTAAGQKVTVERIADRRVRQVDEFLLDTAGLARALKDGDVVQIYALSPRFENAITLRGSVASPGRYPWRNGMRVRDLIPNQQALIVPDYWQRQNLAPGVMGGGGIRFTPDTGARLSASTDQKQQKPGVIPGEQRSRSDGDRRPGEDGSAAQAGEDSRSRETNEQKSRVEVKRTYDEINWDYAVIERLNYSDLTTMLIPFNLGKAVLDGDPSQNLPLSPGDVLTVFSKADIRVPVAKQTKFVRLEGEFVTPGVYQLLPGETLRQLVSRVGGFTANSFLFGSELSRESVRIQQQKRLDEALDRLSQEVERTAAAKSQSGLDTEGAQALAQAESQRRLIARMREIKATGRVVLEIPAERAALANLPEVALEDGDRFIVPARPSTVGVVGSVYNQNAFIYDGNKRLSDYLDQAGGPTREADSARLYIVRADGSVMGRAQGSFFRSFSSERLLPGDTVVVPENLDRFRLTKELKDWSQIFYQFALGVAGLKVLQGL
jgi:polysaccharide export outer membrane protein